MADEKTVDATPPTVEEDTNVQEAPPTVTDETNTGAEDAPAAAEEPVKPVEGKTLDQLAEEDPEAFWHPGRVLSEDDSK